MVGPPPSCLALSLVLMSSEWSRRCVTVPRPRSGNPWCRQKFSRACTPCGYVCTQRVRGGRQGPAPRSCGVVGYACVGRWISSMHLKVACGKTKRWGGKHQAGWSAPLSRFLAARRGLPAAVVVVAPLAPGWQRRRRLPRLLAARRGRLARVRPARGKAPRSPARKGAQPGARKSTWLACAHGCADRPAGRTEGALRVGQGHTAHRLVHAGIFSAPPRAALARSTRACMPGRYTTFQKGLMRGGTPGRARACKCAPARGV